MVDLTIPNQAGNIASLLQDAFSLQGPGGAAYAEGNRAGMIFTSYLRLRSERLLGFAEEFASFDTQSLQLAAFLAGNKDLILPTIEMSVNPNSIRFTQPKRWTKKDTREGSTFFHFTNSKGQNNDILTMNFRGNTGNIDQRDGDAGTARKLLVWHNLYLLTREPMIQPDNFENVFIIRYMSPLFPQMIQFNGFFNSVLEFEENAENPHSRDYSFDFTVTSTEPELDDFIFQLTSILNINASGSTPSSVFSNPEVP